MNSRGKREVNRKQKHTGALRGEVLRSSKSGTGEAGRSNCSRATFPFLS